MREVTDIAVIGMECRFPGANNYQEFWQNIEQGINSISETPSQRWDVEKYYSPNPQEGKSISKWGGFIEEIDSFDAQFFGISPREAQRMDPQQRLMLELTWSCIEDAGYSPLELSGNNVGVFIGVCNFDYKELQDRGEVIEGHNSTGTYTCIIPNRISYFFNFHGPSIPIDTACSSSLVAIHQAVNALNQNECEIALVGGVNVLCTPTSYISFSKLGMLSPEGKCKTFDAEADGYVRGEGAGVILLKPLKKAIEDKNYIYGIVKGSAINHGGHARTLTSPNAYSQSQVVRAACIKANIPPDTVSYIEAHGTGTPLGDPIEINALKRAYTQLYQYYGIEPITKNYCGLGSVKTNIGHLESAAGIAGVIKVLLAMKYKKLPIINNFQQLNTRIQLDGSPFYIVKETKDWQNLKTEEGKIIPRRAGVSSFGFGGVNAHVLLEESFVPEETVVTKIERSSHLMTLSAKTEKALKELARKYQIYLRSDLKVPLGDICYTANTGRSHFDYRLAIVTDSREQLVDQLTAFASVKDTTGLISGQAGKKPPKIAFLFTGQGSQYINMGRQLYGNQPIFHQTLEQCNEILRPLLKHSLLEILYTAPAGEHLIWGSGEKEEFSSLSIDQTAYTQPALFAFEYALYQLWKSWGVEPDVVMGHSVGEYVAACVAGIFSLEDGLKLIAHRGQLMQQLSSGGEMVSLMASEQRVREVTAPFHDTVALAAINGPESVVISGVSEDIAAICQQMEAQGVKTKRLQVSHAFHSPLMTPILKEFEQVANQITYYQPQIPLVSNVTGQLADENIATADYWVHHIHQTVQFADSMQTLDQQGYEIFLEIGPKRTLLGMGRECLPDNEGLWLTSLRPGVPEWKQLLDSLGELYVAGIEIDWLAFVGDYLHQKVPLPTYPFQKQRYWLDNTPSHHQQAEFLSGENIQTPITKFLNQGNTENLVQLVQQAGNFSPEQIKLIPEILAVLVREHKQHLIPENIQDLCYKLVWRNQGNIRQQSIGDYIPTPLEISDRVGGTSHRETAPPEHRLKSQAKHLMSQHHAQQALILAQAIKPKESKTETEKWLIFADKQGIGQELSVLLRSQQKACTLVFPGTEYNQISDLEVMINPALPENFQRLLLEQTATNRDPWQKVVYLWSLDTVETNVLTVRDLETASQIGCGGILYLIQSLINHEFSCPPSLWLVTKGAQRVGLESNLEGIAQSPVWGLGKVITNEHPEFNCTLVDLDPGENNNAQSLFTEICSHKPTIRETNIAFRHGQRYLNRLVLHKKIVKQSLQFQTNATYLITGGLGEIGLLVAQWLVEHGAKHLVLVGRSSPKEAAKATLERLEEAGTQVLVAQTDVSLEKDVTSLLTEIKTSMPELRGIIHAAGVFEDRLLVDHQWQLFAKVFAPKVSGAWNLHTLTQHLSLDFFVLFSSVASVLNLAGVANYAAANAFLDALAHYRRSVNLPGLSINWGSWSMVGMAKTVGSKLTMQRESKGIQSIKPQQALSILENLLPQDAAQVGVMQLNWLKFLEQFPSSSAPSFFGEIPPQIQELASTPVQQQVNLPQLLDQIKASSQEESQSLLINYLSQQIARALGTTPSELNIDEPLNKMGLDSLMAVELKNLLRRELGINIALTKFLDGVSVVGFTKFVSEQLFEVKPVSKTSVVLKDTAIKNGRVRGEL